MRLKNCFFNIFLLSFFSINFIVPCLQAETNDAEFQTSVCAFDPENPIESNPRKAKATWNSLNYTLSKLFGNGEAVEHGYLFVYDTSILMFGTNNARIRSSRFSLF